MWNCPQCRRAFTRANQRHACGTGDRTSVLHGRPQTLVNLYESIEAYARSLGDIEVVTRDRYVLLRSKRVFTDLVMMTDAVRIALHLPTAVTNPLFFKVVTGPYHITHVAKLRTSEEWTSVKSYLAEAYRHSLR